MDGEFTAEALQKLTKNYEDSDDETPMPVVKRLSLSDDGESSLDLNKILSNYSSSPQNGKNDTENNTNKKNTRTKTRKRTPSVTKDSNNRITNYIQSNTNKTTAKSTSKAKTSKRSNTSTRYGIDDLLAENERYKSHQTAKHEALNELRKMDDESGSSDDDVEMQVHNVLLEKASEDGDIEERKQALKSHQKLQKLIAVSQEATENERKDQIFTKNWKKRVIALTPLPVEDKQLAPDCILFTGTVPPFEKLLGGSLRYLVDHEPFLKSTQFVTWLLQICCHSDTPDLVWAANETLIKILDSNPTCKIFTFQLVVDLLNDFGADLSVMGHAESNEDQMEIDIISTDWEWSTRFPFFNLQVVLSTLASAILKNLCDFTREEKYALLGICYHLTLDHKAFKLLPELQRVMEALYISLNAHQQLVIRDIINCLNVESHDYKTFVQCVNMTPYGTILTRFVRQNLAAALLESAAETTGIQYTKMGNNEMINVNNLIKHLKSIKVDQDSDYHELFCVMNLIELAISVHYEQFAKHVDLFMKLHATLLSLSSQIKGTSGIYTAGTQLKEFVVYLCSKIILMKNGYAKQQGRQSFMQAYLDG